MSGVDDGAAEDVTGVDDAAADMLGIGPDGPLTPATATILSGT